MLLPSSCSSVASLWSKDALRIVELLASLSTSLQCANSRKIILETSMGSEKRTEKTVRDIIENTWSWFVAERLKRSKNDQRVAWLASYGS